MTNVECRPACHCAGIFLEFKCDYNVHMNDAILSHICQNMSCQKYCRFHSTVPIPWNTHVRHARRVDKLVAETPGSVTVVSTPNIMQVVNPLQASKTLRALRTQYVLHNRDHNYCNLVYQQKLVTINTVH